VAEVLAEVVAASEGLTAHLKAEVNLVTTVIEAWAADGVASVIPASLFRLADLGAEQLFTFAAQDLALGAPAAARSDDLLLALAARALVARPRALVPAARVSTPAALAAEREGVGAPRAASNPTHKKCGRGFPAAMLRPAASTPVAPRGWLAGTLGAIAVVALELATVLAAIEGHTAWVVAREELLTAKTLLFDCATEAHLRGGHRAGWASARVAADRALVAAPQPLPTRRPARPP